MLMCASGLSFEDRDALERMDVDPLDEEDAPLNLPLPPGEESLFFSHAGGEEELCHEIFSEGGSGYVLIPCCGPC